jgi:hypothetical protein
VVERVTDLISEAGFQVKPSVGSPPAPAKSSAVEVGREAESQVKLLAVPLPRASEG